MRSGGTRLAALAGAAASLPAGLPLVTFRLFPVTWPRRAFRPRAEGAPFTQHLETQRAGGRDSLDQPDLDRIAKPVGEARILANKGVPDLVVNEIFAPDRRGRNETVGACFDKSDEQAGADEARDARLELRADPIGKIGGDQAIGRLPLGRHGPALGVGDVTRDLLKLSHLAVGQAVIA